MPSVSSADACLMLEGLGLELHCQSNEERKTGKGREALACKNVGGVVLFSHFIPFP